MAHHGGVRSCVLIWLAAALAGCAGDGPPANPDAALFDRVQQTIFDVHCLASGCHNAADRANELMLEAGASHQELVNVTPFNDAASSAGFLLVAPGIPEQSFLLTKLIGPGPQQGSRMPLGAGPLSESEINLVREWILAGAPDSRLPTASPTGTAAQAATAVPTGTPTATATRERTEAPTPTFNVGSTLPALQETIFDTTCAVSGCHDTESAPFSADLNLEAGMAFGQLVGVPTTNAAAGMARVDPGNPVSSFLMIKITLDAADDAELGSRMPLAREPLAEEQIERIRAWILRGALADE
jgi:hypothetical protein